MLFQACDSVEDVALASRPAVAGVSRPAHKHAADVDAQCHLLCCFGSVGAPCFSRGGLDLWFFNFCLVVAHNISGESGLVGRHRPRWLQFAV